MAASVAAVMDTSVVLSGATVVLTAVVGITVWINKKLLAQRDEFFKLMSESKDKASELKQRVKVLEVHRDSDKVIMAQVSAELHTVKETLTEMKLQSRDHHLALLEALSKKLGSNE